MASLGPPGSGSRPYRRGVRMAGRIHELVPAIPGSHRPEHHAALSRHRQCDSTGCVRGCGCGHRNALRRCLLDRRVGDSGFQWTMASMGGCPRAWLLAGTDYGTGSLCPTGDLRLHSLSSIRVCIGWRSRGGIADWRVVSVVVSDFPRAGQKCRLTRGAWSGGCDRDDPDCARR